jgi:hypothetical protein
MAGLSASGVSSTGWQTFKDGAEWLQGRESIIYMAEEYATKMILAIKVYRKLETESTEARHRRFVRMEVDMLDAAQGGVSASPKLP